MTEQPHFPALSSLHERHYGVDPSVCSALDASARVCLDRHHSSPADIAVTSTPGVTHSYILAWLPSTQRQRHSLANPDDATRDGAYCLTLAAAEIELGWVACARTPRGSGADYYLKPLSEPCLSEGELDLERAFRLEVSGIDRCRSEAQLNQRVREKEDQTRRGRSDLPALAGVVAFDLLKIVLRAVE